MNLRNTFHRLTINPQTTMRAGFAGVAFLSLFTGAPPAIEAAMLAGLGGGALVTGRRAGGVTQAALSSERAARSHDHDPVLLRRIIVELEETLDLIPNPGFSELVEARPKGSMGIADIRKFVASDGRFDPQAVDKDGWTEAMMIARYAGVEGLKIFVKRGGTFNAQAVNKDGWTEAMMIARHAGEDGLEIFGRYGGTFNPQAINKDGWTEAMMINRYTGRNGPRIFHERLELAKSRRIPAL